jgi:predicted O-methyltransferase YrrM
MTMAHEQDAAVAGWFGRLDVAFYQHQVRRVGPRARFVEIGSWKGRSAVCMASAIRRSGKRIELTCVDTWRGSDEHQDMRVVRDDRLYHEFLRNTAPLREYIRPLRLPSVAAAAEFADGSLDFVFIDAAHDYESVTADIRAWAPKVKPDGVLAGHDYQADWPGVVKAVEEAFGREARAFDSCWYHAPRVWNAAPWSGKAIRRGVKREVARLTGAWPPPLQPRDLQPERAA